MIKESLVNALLSKYEGEMAEAKANIEVYFSNPVGIGEHPDIIAALDSQVAKYAEADEKYNVVSDNFLDNDESENYGQS